MTALRAGPEVPFPMKILDDLLCRDCPFPMDATKLGDDWIRQFDDWRNDLATRIKESLKPGERDPAYLAATAPLTDDELGSALKGRQLRIAEPGAVLTDDWIENRVTIWIDDDRLITDLRSG